MRYTLRDSRSNVLVAIAALYAVVVILLAFAPAIIAGWRVTRSTAGHGVISASLDNGLVIRMTMSATKALGWTGTVNLGMLALLALGPPLLLWLAWLIGARSPVSHRGRAPDDRFDS